MKTKDMIWILILVSITGFVIYPKTAVVFNDLTSKFPYAMGFIKTALLASMGELLVARVKTGKYFSHKGILLRGFVWGMLGMVFVLIFKVFSQGVITAQTAQLLPVIHNDSFGSRLLTAFLISVIMNIFFAPTFMLLHRLTDGYIELANGSLIEIRHVKLNQVIALIDLRVFIGFVVLKTIPYFWIPAHTITFLLPETYRVLMAAYLSIALGILLTIAKSRKVKLNETK
jgi:hypothetical protein